MQAIDILGRRWRFPNGIGLETERGSGELAGLPEEEAREKYRNSPGAVGPALRVGRGFCGQGSLYDRCLPSPNQRLSCCCLRLTHHLHFVTPHATAHR